ncbi:MAG: hypothetical protein FJZ00_13305 [Candidatus Sericytochromatia bacterium]|uniref:Transporter n=1 Tax=Candidatus Tanganyikabacteria bacterium TaxID=2961651 RepID=A0A938BPH0_9BACT|nr:hypothetical protein [Candidatus Tanganyikabacteria bacterium]
MLTKVLPAAAALALVPPGPAWALDWQRPGDITSGSMVVFSPIEQPLGRVELSLGAGYVLSSPPGSVAPPVFPILGAVSRVHPLLEVSALISPNSVIGFRVPHVQEAAHAVGSGFELQAQLDPRPNLPGGLNVPGMGTANLGLQYVLETTQKAGPFAFHTMPLVGYYTKGPVAGVGFAADLDLGPVIVGAGATLRFWYDGRASYFPDQRLGAGARAFITDRIFALAAYNANVPEGVQAALVGVGHHMGH